MNNKAWNIVEVDESSINDLAQLGADIYGQNSELANTWFLKWQYFNNPAGNVVIWVARDRTTSKLAGSYSVIPIRMKIDSIVSMGSLSLNTMTHPDYRNQGIFKALAERTFESCCAKSIILTIGLPNANSYPGFTGALKFKDIGLRDLLIKPISVKFMIKKILRYDLLVRFVNVFADISIKLFTFASSPRRFRDTNIDNIEVAEVIEFENDFDEFWLRASRKYRNMVVHDSKYLNWRFLKCPTRRYTTFKATIEGKLVGYIVATVDEHLSHNCRIVFIVDLMVDSIDAISVYGMLISRIEEWANINGADCMGIHIPPHLEFYNIMKKYGYLNVPRMFLGGSQSFIVRSHSERNFADKELINFSNWYLMDGDNDRP